MLLKILLYNGLEFIKILEILIGRLTFADMEEAKRLVEELLEFTIDITLRHFADIIRADVHIPKYDFQIISEKSMKKLEAGGFFNVAFI